MDGLWWWWWCKGEGRLVGKLILRVNAGFQALDAGTVGPLCSCSLVGLDEAVDAAAICKKKKKPKNKNWDQGIRRGI